MPGNRNQPKAVVLLSGGLDSATTLAVARQDGFAVHALSVDYGQRHRRELECAAVQARLLGAVEHRIVKVDLRAIGGSALTDEVAVPKDRSGEAIGQGIPITYVPARNTVLLALCLGYAETVGAFDLFIGANAIDYSGYPDCRPGVFAGVRVAGQCGDRGRRRREGHDSECDAPLIRMTKAEIIRLGTSLGVDYGQTLSCYDPSPAGVPCGQCDSCQLRAKGFAEAGIVDPASSVL